ncbi:MAG TPA: ATP synthase F1 subunit gamma [Candidatus Hydrogenedentes bacterium]|nr:ATP synthase F1 subunit gamma [Candidatus Hydrogenedentota bacterium]
MPSLRDIKRRITSVQSTQKITRAMKMVAAARLRRAQDAILRTRPYAYRMRALVDNLAARGDRDLHPLLRPGGGGKVGLIVVTADRGLCGAFNANLVNAAMQALQDRFRGRDVELTVVGRKGIESFRRRACTVRATHAGIGDRPAMDAAVEVIGDIIKDYAKGGTDEVHCLYNEFKSAIAQRVTLEQLLPFEPGEPEGPVTDYIYEPSLSGVFETLLVEHLHVQMHRILSESAASEHGARMTAMDAATQNADDVIERLTLQYNRVRQDAITTELIEVVSGAEAL